MVLSRRSRAAQQSPEHSRAELIAETAGPEQTNPHLPPWERDEQRTDLRKCTPIEFLRAFREFLTDIVICIAEEMMEEQRTVRTTKLSRKSWMVQ
eukprot:96427-Rhodomonas_salina.1